MPRPYTGHSVVTAPVHPRVHAPLFKSTLLFFMHLAHKLVTQIRYIFGSVELHLLYSVLPVSDDDKFAG